MADSHPQGSDKYYRSQEVNPQARNSTQRVNENIRARNRYRRNSQGRTRRIKAAVPALFVQQDKDILFVRNQIVSRFRNGHQEVKVFVGTYDQGAKLQSLVEEAVESKLISYDQGGAVFLHVNEELPPPQPVRKMIAPAEALAEAPAEAVVPEPVESPPEEPEAPVDDLHDQAVAFLESINHNADSTQRKKINKLKKENPELAEVVIRRRETQ